MYPPTKHSHPTSEALAKSTQGVVAGVKSSIGESIGSAVGTAASSVISSVAGFFGFDRPRTVAAATRVKPDPLFGLHQSAGLDDSSVVGLDPGRNGLMVPDAGGSRSDEMLINALASTPGLLTTFTWDLSNVDNEVLCTIPVGPQWLPPFSPATTNTPTVYVPTPLARASTPFKAWRGTLRYKVYCIASSFHSARLRVVFTPQDSSINDIFDDALARIIDIQGGTEFSISVPFIWPGLYASDVIGALQFQVETPIAEISEVPNVPMTFLVYVAGSDDLSLKDPTGPLLIPTDCFQQGPNPEGNPRADFEQPFDPLGQQAKSVTFTDPLYFDSPAHVTDLIHRPQSWLTPSFLEQGYNALRLFVLPHSGRVAYTYDFTVNQMSVITPPISNPASGYLSSYLDVQRLLDYNADDGTGGSYPSLWEHFADSYRFQRGGSRIKFLRNSGSGGVRTWTGAPGPSDFARIAEYPGATDTTREDWPASPVGGHFADWDGALRYPITPGTVVTDFTNQLLGEWEIPYSSNRLFLSTGVRPNVVYSNGHTTAKPPIFGGCNTLVADVLLSTNVQDFSNVMRSAADDYRLYYIKGAKPCYLTTATGTMVIKSPFFGRMPLPPT